MRVCFSFDFSLNWKMYKIPSSEVILHTLIICFKFDCPWLPEFSSSLHELDFKMLVCPFLTHKKKKIHFRPLLIFFNTFWKIVWKVPWWGHITQAFFQWEPRIGSQHSTGSWLGYEWDNVPHLIRSQSVQFHTLCLMCNRSFSWKKEATPTLKFCSQTSPRNSE